MLSGSSISRVDRDVGRPESPSARRYHGSPDDRYIHRVIAHGVFIHPSSRELVQTDRIGSGTRIWSNVVILAGASVGADCSIGKDVFIDAGVRVGNRVKIQNGVSLYHGVEVEDGAFFGPHSTTTNDLDPASITPDGRLKGPDDWTVGRTLFRSAARIGAHATILCGSPLRTIGRWAFVGAAALVTRDVPDFALVAGAPAKLVRYVCPRGLGHRVEERAGGPFCDACRRPLGELVGV